MKNTLILGLVGAAAIYAGRKFNLPIIGPALLGPAGTGPTYPIPAILPKNGYGLEWALIPAAGAWYLSR